VKFLASISAVPFMAFNVKCEMKCKLAVIPLLVWSIKRHNFLLHRRLSFSN